MNCHFHHIEHSLGRSLKHSDIGAYLRTYRQNSVLYCTSIIVDTNIAFISYDVNIVVNIVTIFGNM